VDDAAGRPRNPGACFQCVTGAALQVGVGLLPVPLRNPALAAMEIATVARLFPGRFRPGLGHGNLDRPPAAPPPLLVGGRGPKTVRLAGEVADGMILDAGYTLDQARHVFATTAEGRAAAARSGEPFDNVVFVELDPVSAHLAARMDESITALAGVGADTAVFHGTDGAFDPDPLIATLAERG
jgi:alkanesulfonate monooxygenase SsuD/methylene tetrahydromethanopterin reductase-like flavin-dependent oxidoreductase (luciferase family)